MNQFKPVTRIARRSGVSARIENGGWLKRILPCTLLLLAWVLAACGGARGNFNRIPVVALLELTQQPQFR
jgi:hypothetical protein